MDLGLGLDPSVRVVRGGGAGVELEGRDEEDERARVVADAARRAARCAAAVSMVAVRCSALLVAVKGRSVCVDERR